MIIISSLKKKYENYFTINERKPVIRTPERERERERERESYNIVLEKELVQPRYIFIGFRWPTWYDTVLNTFDAGILYISCI